MRIFGLVEMEAGLAKSKSYPTVTATVSRDDAEIMRELFSLPREGLFPFGDKPVTFEIHSATSQLAVFLSATVQCVQVSRAPGHPTARLSSAASFIPSSCQEQDSESET